MIESKITKISDCIRYLNVLISYFLKQFVDFRAVFCLINLSTVINRKKDAFYNIKNEYKE